MDLSLNGDGILSICAVVVRCDVHVEKVVVGVERCIRHCEWSGRRGKCRETFEVLTTVVKETDSTRRSGPTPGRTTTFEVYLSVPVRRGHSHTSLDSHTDSLLTSHWSPYSVRPLSYVRLNPISPDPAVGQLRPLSQKGWLTRRHARLQSWRSMDGGAYSQHLSPRPSSRRS